MKSIVTFLATAALVAGLALAGPQQRGQVKDGFTEYNVAGSAQHTRLPTQTASGSFGFTLVGGVLQHQLSFSATGFTAVSVTVNAYVGGSTASTPATSSQTSGDVMSFTGVYDRVQVVYALTGQGTFDADYWGSTSVSTSSTVANSFLNVGRATTNAPSYGANSYQPLSMNLSGGLRLNVELPSAGALSRGVAVMGDSGFGAAFIKTDANGYLFNQGLAAAGQPVSNDGNPTAVAGSDYGGTPNKQYLKVDSSGNAWVAVTPTASGGLTTFVLEPAASDNHTVVKNGAGQVYHIVTFNNSATVNYGRLYNAGTGFNGCNSASNLVWEFHIPASTTDAGVSQSIPPGLAFSTGISVCVTGGYGQTNVTAATASAITVDIGFK